jgi:predicted dinucleotide-binding enzyme
VRYVPALSTQGPEVLAAPVIAGQTADQFYTADDEEARQLAARLITDVGLRPIYVGGSDRVNIVDGVTRLWFSLAIKQDRGRHLSFRLLALRVDDQHTRTRS